jgi:hypothetical protein
MGPPIAGFAYDAYQAPGALLTQTVLVLLGMALAFRLIFAQREERTEATA